MEGDNEKSYAGDVRLVVSPELRAQIESIKAKRARTVLDHILEHGQITTDELKTLYGYSHPPRAAQDVRDRGIQLVTNYIPGPDGRRMAVYTLSSEASAESASAGRRAFSKQFKEDLVAAYGDHCALCGGQFPVRSLQIDHRVPYQVAGDSAEPRDIADFMLVCGSCNRSKSWSCEHCTNWTTTKDPNLCQTCMWGSPEAFSHIALEDRRQLVVNWNGEDVVLYEALAIQASRQGVSLESLVRSLLDEEGASS